MSFRGSALGSALHELALQTVDLGVKLDAARRQFAFLASCHVVRKARQAVVNLLP